MDKLRHTITSKPLRNQSMYAPVPSGLWSAFPKRELYLVINFTHLYLSTNAFCVCTHVHCM